MSKASDYKSAVRQYTVSSSKHVGEQQAQGRARTAGAECGALDVLIRARAMVRAELRLGLACSRGTGIFRRRKAPLNRDAAQCISSGLWKKARS